MPRYKVLIVEIDSVELPYQTELPLDADRVYFDDTILGLGVTNVQEAIESLGQGTENFSYSIITNKTVTIPTGQQMVVYGGVTLIGTADLIINGDFISFTWS